ncbi:MAG: protease modulator HflC, partial [Planctomycetes bacterium]|nr:protease modulator HflC [Planctomycetota bacterium]
MIAERFRRGATATAVLVAIAVLLLVAWMVLFKVEFTEFALVRTFGQTTRVLNGRRDAGLHVKWPFIQQVVRYDARMHVFEDTMNELPTSDKQNVTLTTYCAWRIADPNKFQTTIGTVQAAENGLRTKVRSAKSAVIGRRKMAELVNTDPNEMHIEPIEQEMLDIVRPEARKDYGIDVVTIGIKSLGLPESVSNRVIEAMKEERQKEVKRYESAGKAEALAITERAREAREQILAFANRKAGEIRAQGDRAAAEWYKQFQQNWQLAAFLRSLESLKKELTGRAIFLLDGSAIPAVKYFRSGPSLPTDLPEAMKARLAPPGPAATS